MLRGLILRSSLFLNSFLSLRREHIIYCSSISWDAVWDVTADSGCERHMVLISNCKRQCVIQVIEGWITWNLSHIHAPEAVKRQRHGITSLQPAVTCYGLQVQGLPCTHCPPSGCGTPWSSHQPQLWAAEQRRATKETQKHQFTPELCSCHQQHSVIRTVLWPGAAGSWCFPTSSGNSGISPLCFRQFVIQLVLLSAQDHYYQLHTHSC